MLIEENVELKLRAPGLLVKHIFLKLVIFRTKQKSSSALFNAKNVAENNQNLTLKCKILNAFWT